MCIDNKTSNPQFKAFKCFIQKIFLKGKTRKSLITIFDQFIVSATNFFTGVIIAEAAALKWKRVDLRNRTVQIHRNLVRSVSGKAIYKKPKTESFG